MYEGKKGNRANVKQDNCIKISKRWDHSWLGKANTGRSHLNYTAVKPDSCLAQILKVL